MELFARRHQLVLTRGVTQPDPKFRIDQVVLIDGYLPFWGQGIEGLVIRPTEDQLRREIILPFLRDGGLYLVDLQEFLPDARPADQLAEQIIGGGIFIVIAYAAIVQVMQVRSLQGNAAVAGYPVNGFRLPLEYLILKPIGKIAVEPQVLGEL